MPLHVAQCFLELDSRHAHQVESLKHEHRIKEAEVEKLNVEILGLKKALASKERALVEKDSHLADLDSLKEQLASSQSVAEALRIANEEDCRTIEGKSAEMEKLKENHRSILSRLDETHTAETSKLREDYVAEISNLQAKHEDALVDECMNGYNEAMAEAADEIIAVMDRIYIGGYEFGLEKAGLSHKHEFFGKMVLCPPGLTTVSSTSESEEEDEEESTEVRPPAP